MPKTKQTVIDRFKGLLAEANGADIAEMERAFYWRNFYLGTQPQTGDSRSATEPKARKYRRTSEVELRAETDPAAKG